MSSPRHLWLICLSVVLICLSVVASCIRPPAEQPSYTTADSAGVTVVRIQGFERLPFPSWQSRLLYTTGATGPLDSIQVGPAPYAVFLSDSSLLVGGGPDLFRVSRRGDSVRRLGRFGNGPGEYHQVGSIRVRADGAVVIGDRRSGRITVLTDRGSIHTIGRLTDSGNGREVELVAALADGRFVSTYWQDRPNRGALAGIPQGGLERDPVPLLLYDAEGRNPVLLGQWLGVERAVVSSRGEIWRVPPAFARSVVYASRGDRTVISPTDSLDLSMFLGDQLVGRIIAPPSGRPPARQDWDGWRRALVNWNGWLGQEVWDALRNAPRVERLPSIGPLALDSRGQVWVGGYALPGDSIRTWRIISAGGRPVGVLDLPAMVDPLVPSRSEILDIYGDLVAILVRHTGWPAIEVRRVDITHGSVDGG